MRTSDFDYDLPECYIAQVPLEERDRSRLMILDRKTGGVKHTYFNDIGNYLRPKDILVVNETRVIPARIFARKIPSGGRVEILLLRKREDHTWDALVGGKGLVAGKVLQLETKGQARQAPLAIILEVLEGAERIIRFDQVLEEIFPAIGHVPLPPYIHTRLKDPERYQTIYGRMVGSAAAPTAGLHFTSHLIDELLSKEVSFASVTLHIGLDTFAPVNEENPLDHKIHTEWCQLSQAAAEKINHSIDEGGRVVAVGTTTVRTLESASINGRLKTFEGPTELYILPGYKFKVVDAMVTNFHLPRSTLIMLVSAFAGRENILRAYEIAKEAGYRFYSFGDAMLII